MSDPSIDAWNNFVMQMEIAPDLSPEMRAAAIANRFMALANNGGLLHFLEASAEIDAAEVQQALAVIGATAASQQLGAVLSALGTPLPAASDDARVLLLESLWREDLDPLDALSEDSDASLMVALERHVAANEAYYRERPAP